MYSTALSTTAVFTLLLAVSASPNPISRSNIGVREAAPEPGPIRIPLNIHDKRQYADDLETRQGWLKQQGKGLRRKYAGHLGEAGKRQLKRDAEDDERDRLSKRASGSAT